MVLTDEQSRATAYSTIFIEQLALSRKIFSQVTQPYSSLGNDENKVCQMNFWKSYISIKLYYYLIMDEPLKISINANFTQVISLICQSTVVLLTKHSFHGRNSNCLKTKKSKYSFLVPFFIYLAKYSMVDIILLLFFFSFYYVVVKY